MLLHPSNAPCAMLVTPSWMKTEVSLVQFSNADLPISFTLPGIVIEVSAEQSLKVDTSIASIPLGIIMDLRLQPENASNPMLVTLSGITIDVRPVQPAKAELAILFVPSFTTIVVFSGISPT